MALFFANLAIILETVKSYAGGLHDKSFPWFSFSVFVGRFQLLDGELMQIGLNRCRVDFKCRL